MALPECQEELWPTQCQEDGTSLHVWIVLKLNRLLLQYNTIMMLHDGLATWITPPASTINLMYHFAGLVDLPWNRVGVWAVVIWFMYSLKDFFGVC